MDIKDIEKLAQLSRLSLSKEEKEKFLTEIGSILEYVGEIKKVASSVGEAGKKPVLRNVMREDSEPNKSGENTETLLSSAPKREKNYVKVKKIL